VEALLSGKSARLPGAELRVGANGLSCNRPNGGFGLDLRLLRGVRGIADHHFQ